jgi:Mg-chelatase subunit ChlD
MAAAKVGFVSLVTRTLAYRHSHDVGLITFSDAPQVDEEINDIAYEFMDKLNDVRASGWTALWKSLELARNKLAECSDGPKRIVVLSDGEDTVSDGYAGRWYTNGGIAAQTVCQALQVVPRFGADLNCVEG